MCTTCLQTDYSEDRQSRHGVVFPKPYTLVCCYDSMDLYPTLMANLPLSRAVCVWVIWVSSVCPCVSVCLSVGFSGGLSGSLVVCLSVWLPGCLAIWWSGCLAACFAVLTLCMLVCQFPCLTLCLCVCSSACFVSLYFG